MGSLFKGVGGSATVTLVLAIRDLDGVGDSATVTLVLAIRDLDGVGDSATVSLFSYYMMPILVIYTPTIV